MLRPTALFVLLAITAACAGCLKPSVRMTQAQCTPEYVDNKLKALRFTTAFEARNLAEEQLLYEVALLDSSRRPLPTVTGRYSDAQGHMTAGKAIMVLRPYWEFSDVSVTLPASELEANGLTDVTWAEFRIRDARTGSVLAQQQVPVGEPSLAKAPPRAAQPRTAAGTRPSTEASRQRSSVRPEPASARRDTADRTRAGDSAVTRGDTRRESAAPAERTTRTSPADSSDAAARRSRAAGAPQEERVAGNQARGETAKYAPKRNDVRPPASQPAAETNTRATATAAQPAVAPRVTSAPASAPGATVEEYYVVSAGDTLISIAREKLGDPWRWREIYALNRSQLNWPDELRAGMKLRLPPR